MYSIQGGKTLQQILKLFYLSGIWQSNEESKYRRISKRLFYTFFAAFCPSFFATNSFLCADRNEMIFSTQAVILASVIYVKSLYLLFKKPEILAFLYDPIVVHSIETREEYERMSKKIKKFMTFVRPYFLAICLTAASLIIIELPIFSADKGLPFFISFTWNDSEVVYWLAYLFLSLSTVLYCVINFSNAIIWYIMLNYSVEYQLLGNRLRNLGVTIAKNQNKNEKEKKIGKPELKQKTINSVPQSKKFVENLIVLVKAHRNMTETIERFRILFLNIISGPNHNQRHNNLCFCGLDISNELGNFYDDEEIDEVLEDLMNDLEVVPMFRYSCIDCA
ncbi:uncharacterized protein LOC119080059 [Bradysia coprophila]|uniref:uncharacterized protein LOC119080059 n=1 Tax=Bradysia coprophila TaxID=38358 RepID=UPI00187D7078|nr:uncharacterized protein LOC119080059 [Bradysia coprophila]